MKVFMVILMVGSGGLAEVQRLPMPDMESCIAQMDILRSDTRFLCVCAAETP